MPRRTKLPLLFALLITITWEKDTVTIERVEKRDMPVPLQRGMPQLWSRFFELRNKSGDEGDVFYAGPLSNVRTLKANPSDAGVPTYTIVVPDLPDARRLVVYQRDPKSGSASVAEKDL